MKTRSALAQLFTAALCSSSLFGQAQPPLPPVEASAINRPPVSLRVVGSNLMNPQGQYLGRIEEVLLHPVSNQIEFGLVATTNSPLLTPVPWQMFNYVWDQSKAGGIPGAVQTFSVSIDRLKLEQAPKIARNHSLDQPRQDWMQSVYAFYGTNGFLALGGTGSSSSSTSGSASGGGQVPVAAAAGAATANGVSSGAAVAPGFSGGGDFVGSGFGSPGFVVGFTTNAAGVITTNLVTGTITNVINPGVSNAFAIPATGTNVFPGATGTNIFPGAPTTPGATTGTPGTSQNGQNGLPTVPAAPPGINVGGGPFRPMVPVNPGAGTTTPPPETQPPTTTPPTQVAPDVGAGPLPPVVPNFPNLPRTPQRPATGGAATRGR